MSRNNSKLNKNDGFSKPQTVLPASTTANTAADQDPKLQKQYLKNQISDLKAQQKEITRNLKGLEKQLSNLAAQKKRTTNKK